MFFIELHWAALGSLKLQRGPQGTSHVASGKSCPLSIAWGHLGIPLELLHGNRASSQVETGISGFLCTCDRDRRFPICFNRWRQGLSPVEAWNSAFFSRYKRGVRIPVEFRRVTCAFSRSATGESDLLLVCEGRLRVPLELV